MMNILAICIFIYMMIKLKKTPTISKIDNVLTKIIGVLLLIIDFRLFSLSLAPTPVCIIIMAIGICFIRFYKYIGVEGDENL